MANFLTSVLCPCRPYPCSPSNYPFVESTNELDEKNSFIHTPWIGRLVSSIVLFSCLLLMGTFTQRRYRRSHQGLLPAYSGCRGRYHL